MHIKAGTIKGLLRLVPRTLDGVQYRQALFGLTFEPDGTVMATNGHSLLAFKSRCEFDGEGFVIGADALRAAIKGKKPREAIEIKAPDEKIAPVSWRRVIPSEFTGEREESDIDPELVLNLRDAINEIQETEGLSRASRSIRVLQVLPNGSRAWLAYVTDRLLAVVMPLRGSDRDFDQMRTCAAEFMKSTNGG